MKTKAKPAAATSRDSKERVSPTDGEHRYRSGEAARLANMPPTTLRMWERRYGVIGPLKSESGQRLYSEDDVRRLVLLKALVRQGHAIGSVARLARNQLEALLQTRPGGAVASAQAVHDESGQRVRIATVGAAISRRLRAALEQTQRADAVERLDFSDLTEVGAAAGKGAAADALVIDVLSLTRELAAQVLEMRDRLHARMAAVSYAYGNAQATETLRMGGVRLYRAPMSAVEMRQLAGDLYAGGKGEAPVGLESNGVRAPRRFDDETLERVMAQSSVVRCECPQHLGELIMRLDAFERYSDDCTSRSVDDAVLHRHLGNVANQARAMLEAALERVVAAEETRGGPQAS